MHKRLVWLAPLALATLLTGCSVTVTTLGPAGPSTLVGYRLELINNERGGPLTRHGSSDPIVVSVELTYYFWNDDEARSSDFDFATPDWRYTQANGSLRIVFRRNNFSDLITNCVLTFERSHSGTHRCEFEDTATRTIDMDTARSGWSEGTFTLKEL